MEFISHLKLGDCLMKAERPVVASDGIPYLQMMMWDHTARQEGRREGTRKGVSSYEDAAALVV